MVNYYSNCVLQCFYVRMGVYGVYIVCIFVFNYVLFCNIFKGSIYSFINLFQIG